MTQYILMNKETGNQAIGVRLYDFDNQDDFELMPSGLGKITWRSEKPHYWAVSGDVLEPFVLVPFDLVDKQTEIIGKL